MPTRSHFLNENPELLVVLPVYNERDSVRYVIEGWIPVLEQHVSSYLILAINDGSTDDTAEILSKIKANLGNRLEVIDRENRGHGQSCLQGYRIAEDRLIPYVLQIDSDGQSDPRFFDEFWKMRGDYEVIYGNRRRLDGWRRKVASHTLGSLLKLLEGVDCIDANVPYRLMDTMACRNAFRAIPSSLGLANVALAVQLKRMNGIREGQVSIDFPPRHGGEPSVPMKLFLIKGFELFVQLRQLRKNRIV